MTAAAFALFATGYACGWLSRSALAARWADAAGRRRDAVLAARFVARGRQ